MAGGVIETDLSQSVDWALMEWKHCSLHALFDFFNELEKTI